MQELGPWVCVTKGKRWPGSDTHTDDLILTWLPSLLGAKYLFVQDHRFVDRKICI